MKKQLNILLALALAFNLLLSFAGIRMLVHYCFQCDNTEYALFTDIGHDCCDLEHNHNHDKNSVNDCCSVLDSPDTTHEHCDSCCETEFKYIQHDYKAANEKPVVKINIPVTFVPETIETACCASCVEESRPAKCITDPPPRFYSGRDFVLFSHQIKVC